MDQTYFTTLSLVVSFLGGGIIGAFVNYIRVERSEKKERQLKFLEEQIRHLYGPLYYWVSQNVKLFELNNRFLDAYDKEFIQQRWATDPETRESVRRRSGLTIELANKYIGQVENNNENIKNILDSHSSYVDPDDVDIFLLFFEHRIRKIIEIDETGKLLTPDEIYYRIGQISFLRPEFIDRVQEKFFAKKLEMNKLVVGGSAKEWLKIRFK
jgi:hypothetical protein